MLLILILKTCFTEKNTPQTREKPISVNNAREITFLVFAHLINKNAGDAWKYFAYLHLQSECDIADCLLSQQVSRYLLDEIFFLYESERL